MSVGGRSTRNSRLIAAPPTRVFAAFTDPDALAEWLPPAAMTGRIHSFVPGAGGGFVMSLYYPESETEVVGKTAEREDRVEVRVVALDPPRRLVWASRFVTEDPALQGEMRLSATFDDAPGGTLVTLAFDDLPPGLAPEDNETGAELSLAQLAARFEAEPQRRET